MTGDLLLPGDIDYSCPINWDHPLAAEAGLQAFWLGLPDNGWSGGDTLRDLCGHSGRPGNHGTLTNGPTWAAGANGFGAVSFDGSNDYVDAGNPASLQFTGTQPYTLFVVYRLAATPASIGAAFQLFTKDSNTGGRAYTLDVFRTGIAAEEGVRFYVNGGGSAGTNQLNEGVAAAVGDWKAAFGVFGEDTVLRLYTCNLSTGTWTTFTGIGATSTPSATANVWLGRRAYSGFEESLNGRIDVAAAWSRGLPEGQIRSVVEQFRRGWPTLLRRVSERTWFVGSMRTVGLVSRQVAYGFHGRPYGSFAGRDVTPNIADVAWLFAG